MKKILLALAVVVATLSLASCSGESVEKKVVSFAEKMMEAKEKGDTVEMKKISKDCNKWLDTMNESDQKAALEAAQKWVNEYEAKTQTTSKE